MAQLSYRRGPAGCLAVCLSHVGSASTPTIEAVLLSDSSGIKVIYQTNFHTTGHMGTSAAIASNETGRVKTTKTQISSIGVEISHKR